MTARLLDLALFPLKSGGNKKIPSLGLLQKRDLGKPIQSPPPVPVDQWNWKEPSNSVAVEVLSALSLG
jgi:hypothetical protein